MLATGTFVICLSPKSLSRTPSKKNTGRHSSTLPLMKSRGISKEIYQGKGSLRVHHVVTARSSESSILPGKSLYETYHNLAVMCRQKDRLFGLTSDEGNFNFGKQKLFLTAVHFGAFNQKSDELPDNIQLNDLFFSAESNSAVIDFKSPSSLIEATPLKGEIGSSTFSAKHAEASDELLMLYDEVSIDTSMGHIDADRVHVIDKENPTFVAIEENNKCLLVRDDLFIEGARMTYSQKSDTCLVDDVEGKTKDIFFSANQLIAEKKTGIARLTGMPYVRATFGELITDQSITIQEKDGVISTITSIGKTQLTTPDLHFRAPDGLFYDEKARSVQASSKNKIELRYKEHHIISKKGTFLLDESNQLKEAIFEEKTVIEGEKFRVLADAATFDMNEKSWHLEGDLHCVDKIEKAQFFADEAWIKQGQIEVVGTLHGFKSL